MQLPLEQGQGANLIRIGQVARHTSHLQKFYTQLRD